MIRLLVKIISFLYLEKVWDGVEIIRRLIKSEYYSRKFLECGRNFRLFFPVQIKGAEYMVIGNNFSADYYLQLQCWDVYEGEKYIPKLVIGDNVHLGNNCHISAINSINIGNNLLTGKNVYISDHSHGKILKDDYLLPPIKRKLYSKGKVVIGDNVWLGNNVCVLPGVKIGDNSVVGANSVVTKNIPSNTVVAGVPAKIIKETNKG